MKNKHYVATCYFLDVGQGASQVILLGDQRAVIIDTGIKRKVFESPLVKLLKEELKIQIIEVLILSHNDKDHVGDAETLFDEYQQNIKEVYYLVDRPHGQNQSYCIAMNAVKEKYLDENKIYRLEVGKAKDIFSEEQLQISVLFPNFYNNQKKEKNNTCAIIALTVGTQKIIFSGDTPVSAWENIVKRNGNKQICVNILTVPHHGGQFTNNEDDVKWFFENVHTKYAVVSVGYNNPYKHPNKDVICSLVQHGTEIFCTQSNLICNGLHNDNKICCGTIIADISTDETKIRNFDELQKRKSERSQRLCCIPSD
jgi:competence protein ComEC